jgi:hypothetical protein
MRVLRPLHAKAGPKYELLATNPMDQVIMATLAIADGVIFVRGLKDVFAVGRRWAP